jgi:predicted nucleotidyltransferase component of viral defense system
MDAQNKVLFYTFRTFPQNLLNKLELPIEPFIFGKLNDDLKRFKKYLAEYNPTDIIGFAKGDYSRFERVTINNMGYHKKVLSIDTREYPLIVPEEPYKSIQLSRKPTDTFCNWTMFQIAHIANPLSIKVQFIHIAPKDIFDLKDFFTECASQQNT